MSKGVSDKLVIVRGAGDIATGSIHRLVKCGFKVVALELDEPSAIRRSVSFSECMYEGETTVEGVTSKRVYSIPEALEVAGKGFVAVLAMDTMEALRAVRPHFFVEATISKRSTGVYRGMAEFTIGLGPGFVAGEDVDVVIETMRGHNLGRIIKSGSALANTGVPGMVGGEDKDRVIHSSCGGIIFANKKIGDIVTKGEEIAYIIEEESASVPVLATIDGLLRGIIHSGYKVTKGFKIADIDPRLSEYENCFTISDKARCIAGSVLEVMLENLDNK